jgi:hypothetical protein
LSGIRFAGDDGVRAFAANDDDDDAAAAAPAAMVWSAARASAASFRYGVIAEHAALKDQPYQRSFVTHGTFRAKRVL